MKTQTLSEIRRAFADYVSSEGCSCCRADDRHEAAAARMAKLLRIPKYKDGSGYDITKFVTRAAGERSK